jgi:cell division protein FtsW
MRFASSLILVIVGLLLALSITMLSSAVMLDKQFTRYVSTQAVAIGLGLAGLLAASMIDYRQVIRRHWWFYGAAIVTLALVLSPLGTYRNGAQRWLFGVQPAEFAKIALLLTLVWYVATFSARMGTFVWGVLYPGSLVVPLLVLLYLQPDRGTLILFGLVTAAVLLVGGMRLRYAALPFMAGLALFAHFFQSSPMVRTRVDAFIRPELYKDSTAAQALKSLAALREGGVHGAGLGKGVIKLRIPEQHTDFILPVIGEELGLVATLAVLVAFAGVLIAGAWIARHAADPTGQILAAGITYLIAMQALINFAVVTNSMPNKGMPLPFVSRGGSSVAAMLVLVGLLLSVARHSPTTGEPPLRRGKDPNPFGDPEVETLPAQ